MRNPRTYATAALLSTITVLTACQQQDTPTGQYLQLNAAQNEKPFSLQFDQGRLSGFTGCNRAMGNFTVDEGKLVVSQLAGTMMACQEDAMQREQAFHSFLQSGPALSYDNKMLVLRKDDTEYRFSAQPDLSNATTRLIYVAPERKSCVGIAPMQCLQVRDTPEDAWQLHYGEIEGFTPQPGVAYRLRIKEMPVANPPADAPDRRWILDMIVEQQQLKTE
ncbi:DUF4377 domain-containing protein [Rheinheimera sp. NSM]|uniref:DUF4377 domain-containing protein n=1 Tax=Rheinheimera sp. NSM TaxID=3457884 RepID=UPI0040365DBE